MLEALRRRDERRRLRQLARREDAVITLREPAPARGDADRLARELRLRAHRRLRAAGVYAMSPSPSRLAPARRARARGAPRAPPARTAAASARRAPPARSGFSSPALGVRHRRSRCSRVGIGGAIAYQKGCSLASLEPFSIGQNTFIYAADGSRLGVDPVGRRNRQKVPWRAISPWVPKATVAIEDKRFWQHGGIDPIGITRAFWADVSAGQGRPGRLDDHAAARPQPLHLARADVHAQAARGVPRGQARRQVVEAEDPHDLPEPDLLRQPGLRRRGGRADVLLEAGEGADARAGRAARRPAAGAVAGTTRSRTRARHARGATQVLRAMLRDRSRSRGGSTGTSCATTICTSKPGELYKRIRQPYFFSYVRDELVRVYGEARVRHGGLRVYTTIDPRLQRDARQAIKHDAELAGRSGGGGRRDRPGERRDPRDDGRVARAASTTSSTSSPTHVASRARRSRRSCSRRRSRQGMDPESTYYLSAPLALRRPARARSSRGTSRRTTTRTRATRRSRARRSARTTPCTRG